MLLHTETLDADLVRDTLNVILKFQEDIVNVDGGNLRRNHQQRDHVIRQPEAVERTLTNFIQRAAQLRKCAFPRRKRWTPFNVVEMVGYRR